MYDLVVEAYAAIARDLEVERGLVELVWSLNRIESDL